MKPDDNFSSLKSKTVAHLLIILVLAFSLINITGWIFGIPVLKGEEPGWTSMKPSTAICFILISCSVLLIQTESFKKSSKVFALICGSLVIFIAALTVAAHLYEMKTGKEISLAALPVFDFFLSDEMRMALVNAILIIITGIIIGILGLHNYRLYGVAHIITLPVLLVTYFVPMSYIVGVTNTYSINNSAVSLYSGIDFILTFSAILLYYPDTWLMRVFSDRYSGGNMARRLIPGIIIIPVIIAWISLKGEKSGFFNSEVQVILVGVTYTFCFLILIWMAARRVIKLDLLEREKASALSESESRFKAIAAQLESILNCIPVGVLVYDHDVRIIRENTAAELLLGYPEGSTALPYSERARNLFEIWTENGVRLKPEELPSYKAAVDGKTVMNQILLYKTVSRSLWMNFSAAPLVIDGRHSGAVISMLDITDLKKTQDELLKSISEMKLAEQRLKESETILDTFFNNTPVGMLIYSDDNRYIRLNKLAADLYGVQVNDALGKSVFDVLSPELAKATEIRNDEVLKLNKPVSTGVYSAMLPLHSDQAKISYWQGYRFPVHLPGAKQGVGVVTLNISDRIEAESQREAILEELQLSEQRLKVIFDNTAIGIAEVDEQDRFISVNNRICEILGYSRDELLSKVVYEITAPEDLDHSKEINARIHRNELDIFDYEKRYIKKDGSYLWVHVSLSAVRYPHGHITIRTVEDVTARKAAEEALKESEEMFSTMVQVLPIGIALTNFSDMTVFKANPAWLNLTGYTKEEEVLGKTSTELGIVRDLKDQERILEEFRKNGKVRNIEATIFTTNDARRIVSINMDQVYIKGQKYFLASVNDITGSKAMEQEIKHKNEELTRFIYTVSHDLKSPLVTIKSFTFYLHEDIERNDKDAQERDIKYIVNAADKMGNLLDELLELSRIGRKEEAKTAVPMKNIVHAAIDLVAGRISNAGVKVIVTGPDLMLYGHSQRLLQLYQNLIDNSVKFMGKQNEPLVEIGSFFDDERNNWVLFVRDNGSGIDPRFHHKIFGLFEKLDNSTEGTGIGLALIKRIIEIHNGAIWFESDGKDKGTTFYFTLEMTKMI